MKSHSIIHFYIASLFILIWTYSCQNPKSTIISPRHKVTLNEAHIGNQEIDIKLLDSYGLLPENIRNFYSSARSVFSENSQADFTHPEIIEAARKNKLPLMGGPMLGNLSENGVTIWLRSSANDSLVVKVSSSDGRFKKSYFHRSGEPGIPQRIILDGLSPDTGYKYAIFQKKQRISEGSFTTAPASEKQGTIRIAFGSCFHKIGLHNPNLIHQILKREPLAMMLLGDIAVDDRENQINMHRADYLLRDVSKPWRMLSAHVPLYTSWDDHDYLNNDLNGIPKGFTDADRKALREVWYENWNNPEKSGEGIYFNARIGPVEIIMPDTRSCRENERRGQYGSYLGLKQLEWLKETLKNSSAPFKIISSGTMWSDYISNGKDSWGTWDVEARDEIFNFIEKEKIQGVLLVSGDRHGARGFTIPRQSGFVLHEFEVATLGGVAGPEALANNPSHQLFGYHGADIIAFGEFTFDLNGDEPLATFRLIDELGTVLEEINLPYSKLTTIGK